MTALTYRSSGVDIDEGDALVDLIKPLAAKTRRDGVVAGIGGFGALFAVPKQYREPILVSGTDGVGTKLKLAFALDRHDSIGQDLVAMSVNDILVQGAEPLFFLDYFACGKLHKHVAETVIGGIAEGCRLAGCALIGGETAEMPGMYPEGEYDLAGFAVGVVEKSQIVSGKDIAPGDVLIGLAASGLHSNGFSLVRKIVDRSGLSLTDSAPFAPGLSLGEALLTPTRIYVSAVRALLPHVAVKGMAHITGGGIIGNVPRMLPPGTRALIDQAALPKPALFDWLQQTGEVSDNEMRRVFNHGVGFVLAVAAEDAVLALHHLLVAGETAWVIGEIAKGETDLIYR